MIDDAVPPEERAITEPGAGSLTRAEARRDAYARRWDVVSPSATQIGRSNDPSSDVSERLRRLHEERHPAMQGHGERAHRLDKLRVSHALCNVLDLTPWQRDRVLGIMEVLDLTAFGSRRGIPIVALVTIRHVVDRERRRYLGLDDAARIRELSPSEMERLYEEFESIADDQQFSVLLEQHDLDATSLNRLERVLSEQLDERDLEEVAFGRQPHRDPNLPALSAVAGPGAGD